MRAHSPGAYLSSLVVHAGILGLVLGYTLLFTQPPRELPQVFTLMSGPPGSPAPDDGTPDDGGPISTEAPDIKYDGNPDPIPLPELPPAPTAQPVPLAQAQPVPQEVKEVAPQEEPPLKIKAPRKSDIVRQVTRRSKAIKKTVAEQEKQTTLEEFRRQQAAKGKRSTGKPPSLNANSLGRKLRQPGGSGNGGSGGSGGQGRGDDPSGTLLANYDLELNAALKRAWELDKVDGLSDRLRAKVSFVLSSTGVLSRPEIVETSGSAEFDRAVLSCIQRFRMFRPPPDRRTVALTAIFSQTEEN